MTRKKHPTLFKGGLRNVDLEALKCLDIGHQWRLVEQRTNSGALVGCPERVKMCMECSGIKIETSNWRGEILNRRYISDSVYLANSRLLSDDVNRRRQILRALLLEREFGRQPVDKVCSDCSCPLEWGDEYHEECER